jgi:hypothetical protein
MAGFVLFETTESVIEDLWDIALAYSIVRLAFVYFLSTFVSWISLSYLYTTYHGLLPARLFSTMTTTTRSPEIEAEVVLAPAILAFCAIWARFIVAHYEVPRIRGFRLATGLVALVFMVAADGLTAFVLYVRGHHVGKWILPHPSRLTAMLLLAALALSPLAMIPFERKAAQIRDSWHDHAKKNTVDAV